jgi:short-subunit dehydrogenase
MARRSIAGCRALLTGASSGIGFALAGELVRAGSRLLVVARRQDRLQELAAQLAGSPGEIYLHAGDVTSPAVRAEILARAQSELGGLDLLVNNAGIGAMGRFAEASPERLRQVMEVNFFAAAELTRAALPILATGTRPMVVNVGSILAHRGIPFCAEYCASKFALQGWSESLRAEVASSGIDVLVVSPGTTRTEFFERAIDARAMPWSSNRGMAPEAVARCIVSAIRSGRHEIVVGGSGKLLVWMNRLFPRAVDAFMGRYG